MGVVCVFFASSRYWPDEAQLQEAYTMLQEELPFQADEVRLDVDGKMDFLSVSPEDILVAVPMSGAIQQPLLDAAGAYNSVLLYAAYVPGNAEKSLTDAMLTRNAAPPVADCWSVLRRSHKRARLCVTREDAARSLRVLDALSHLQSAKLLMIGRPEPWVVSAGWYPAFYENLGIQVEQVSQSEVEERYQAALPSDAEPYAAHFEGLAANCVEPSKKDLQSACRMAFAIVETLKAHKADGISIACFKLLETGTNSCLGVSYINDCTPWIAACEGDMDSALTMLAMKRLTRSKLWMANTGLHGDGTMNFSHCTAPILVDGETGCPCTLRSHHESGIGVSLEVSLPVGRTVTACRISAATGQATIRTGTTFAGAYEPVCRTQLHVRFEDNKNCLDTLLGCHQVFAFENIEEEMRLLCEMAGISVLS